MCIRDRDNIITVTREISLKWPEFDYLVINDGSVDETSKICMENKIDVYKRQPIRTFTDLYHQVHKKMS